MRPHIRNPFSRGISLEVPILEDANPSSVPNSSCSVPGASSSAPIPSESLVNPLEEGEVTGSQPNTTANETRDLVWAVYKAKPWCAPHKEVMKTWNAVAEDLKARGICNRDGQYIRRKILNLIEIHHDPEKKWKFFATEEVKASLEGALERISYDWDKSEENKRSRTRVKRRADELRDREGEILKISAVSPLVRTSTVSLDSLRSNNQQQSIKKWRGQGKGPRLDRVTQKKQRISSDSEQNGDSCRHADALVGKIETVLNRFIDTVQKN
jgi:hypothetical protein